MSGEGEYSGKVGGDYSLLVSSLSLGCPWKRERLAVCVRCPGQPNPQRQRVGYWLPEVLGSFLGR